MLCIRAFNVQLFMVMTVGPALGQDLSGGERQPGLGKSLSFLHLLARMKTPLNLIGTGIDQRGHVHDLNQISRLLIFQIHSLFSALNLNYVFNIAS